MKSQTLSAQLTEPVFKTWTYRVTVNCNIVGDCKIKALYKVNILFFLDSLLESISITSTLAMGMDQNL